MAGATSFAILGAERSPRRTFRSVRHYSPPSSPPAGSVPPDKKAALPRLTGSIGMLTRTG